MKRWILIFTVIFFSGNVWAQCPTGDITLSTQQQIDDFVANYPGCTEIDGNILIGASSNTNVTSLNELSQLTSIGGNLRIVHNDLTSLTGLENISSVGGDLIVHHNYDLLTLMALENISSVGGRIGIAYTDALTTLTGLENISSVGGGISIAQNDALTTLTALENIDSVEGIGVSGNAVLTTLAGLENISSVEGGIVISYNDALTTLTGLENISSVGGGISITNNDALTTLTGLENISSVGGNLRITNNDVLTTLGLENISSVGGDLDILGNGSLTTLAGLENISSVEGQLRIYDNDALTTLAALGNISSVEGDLTIYFNDALTTLAGLENISSVGGDLWISKNDVLTTLAGLENISSVGGGMTIWDNDSLTTLVGLENVSLVGGNLEILYSDALTTLGGLENLSFVGGNLELLRNDSLTTLAGLANLSTVEGDLMIIDNDNLTTLIDLESLSTIRGGIEIIGNAVLANLTGLENINSIRKGLNISGNSALINLTGLENLSSVKSLEIKYNYALIELTGLASFINIKDKKLRIEYNSSLSLCSVSSICYYLLDVELNAEGMAIIEGNAPDCNNAEEVSSLCGGFSFVEVLTFYDANQNQVQDTNEPDLEGAVLVEPINGTYTGNDSIYLFSGNYTISLDQTAFSDWELTTDSASYFVTLEADVPDMITFGLFPRESSLSHDKLVYPSRMDNHVLFEEDLVYTIRFQNTGDNIVDNIVIRDTLDGNLDHESLYLLGSSHPDHLNTNVSPDGILTFEFNDIFLPDSTSNFEGSRGYVTYLIRAIDGLADSTSVTNSASIYFDLNSPLRTNTTQSIMVGQTLDLPIETLDPLRVYLNNQTALLTWRTATENNNSGFEIQRSKDGIEWEKIGWQAGQGSTSTPHSYIHTDRNPLSGTSYYRLKQVDFNGDTEYSNIVSLQYVHNGVTVYPNPVKEQLYLDVDGGFVQKIAMYNSIGSQVAEIANPGNEIDVSALSKGIYVLKITIDDEDFYEKIIVE